jgi:8-oxo-dGTP diphosphatase
LAAPGADPRIRVAAVIMIDGMLVTVRHRKGDSVYHLLPGGGVEPGESLGDALAREVLEETGLSCEIVKPLFISDTLDPSGRIKRHIVNITFLARYTGGTITDTPLDDRIEAVELIDPSTLPDLDLRPPMAAELLAALEDGFGTCAVYLGALWTEGRS